jgi:methylated-DNA-protein-cysteine methyltransferase related protein
LPWHRVVNARGEISLGGDSALEQKRRLRREGVRFDARDRIDLREFGWIPAAVSRKRRASTRGAGTVRD